MGKEELFTTIVQDEFGKTIETWKVMKKDYANVVKILNKKYGLNIRFLEPVKSDIDWAM